jgi:hypothetical protein
MLPVIRKAAMELSTPNLRRASYSRLLLALIAINGAFVLGVLAWWQLMSQVMAAPVRWATWQAMAPRPAMLDYPFIMLWALPVTAIGVAWFARQFGNLRFACGAALFPVFYLSLMVGWFYLAPPAWH